LWRRARTPPLQAHLEAHLEAHLQLGRRYGAAGMKNVTPPHDRPRESPDPARRRGASIVAGIALLPFVLIGLAVAGVALAVGLIWAAAWAVVVAIGGAFLVAGLAAAVAVLRAQQTRDGRPR
jgi:Flp pilus assembly protein TadB